MTQAPARTRPAPMAATVLRTGTLSPTLTRVVLGGDELRRFQPNTSTDAYVKLSFLKPGIDYPRPIDLERVRAEMPAEDWPVVRTYTVRAFDVAAAEMTIDFVVHGDAGIAGPWAASARPGDELLIAGPGGGYAPSTDAAFYLFIGDESALPAIAAALERLPVHALGRALIEVHDASSEVEVQAPGGVVVDWVHAGDRQVGEAVVEAAGALDFPAASVDAFVHGEAGFVKDLRRLLRIERALPRERLSISGYWRVGATDEDWRAAKADWNRQVEDAERAAGVA